MYVGMYAYIYIYILHIGINTRGRLNCAITTKLNYAMAMFLTVTFKWS